MLWCLVLIPFVIVLAGSFLIASDQVGHRVALKRLPIVLACMAGALGINAVLGLSPLEWKDHAWSGLYLIFSLYAWVYLAIFLRRAAQAGDTLLELGRPRHGLAIGTLGIVAALFSGSMSILDAFGDGNVEAASQIRFFSTAIFWFSAGIHIFLIWAAKSSIRQSGIIVHGQIFKWAKIEGFQWDLYKPSTLVLSVKRLFPFWRTIHLPIASNKQDAVNVILRHNLAVNTSSGSPG